MKTVVGDKLKGLFDAVGVGGVEINFKECFLHGDKEFAQNEYHLEYFVNEGVEVDLAKDS